MRKITEITILVIVLSALTALFFKDVIFSNNMFVMRDLSRYFYPLRGYAFGLVKQGVVPLWNPLLFCGNPLLATHQVAVFYPVSAVYLLGNFDKAFNNFIYIHFVLAGLFMYIFLSDRKISRTGSFIGAITFAFSGYMLAVINLLASLASAAWVPITLWAFFRAREKASYPYAMLTAAFLSCMFLAGEPAILYATSLIMVFCGLKNIRILASVFIAFLLLSSVQLLPFIELIMKSDRANMSYDIATKWSVPPHDFLNLIFPCVTEIERCFRGYWEKQSWLLAYYLGLMPLFMLPISVIFIKGKEKALIFSILVAAIILSLGKYTPIYRVLLDYLPGFRLSRYPVKFFCFVTFALSWISAIGYDFYAKNARTDERLKRFIKALLYTAFVAGLCLFFFDLFFKDLGHAFHRNFLLGLEKSLKEPSNTMPFVGLGFFTIRRTLVFFLVFVLALFLGTKRFIRPKALSVAMIALVAADLYSAAFDINLYYDITEFKAPTENIEFLMKDKTLFRFMESPATLDLMQSAVPATYVNLLKGGKERLYSNRMMEYGLYDAAGYESLDRKRMLEVLFLLVKGVKSPDETRVLDMLNVKYIVSPKIFEAKGYKLLKKSDITNLYENMNVLPRTFLAERAVVLKTPREICAKFQERSWDPLKEVVLEEAPVLQGTMYRVQGTVDKKESAEITKYAPNEVIVRACVKAPKFLVLSDSYYPGWKVYVDGRPDKIYAANYIVRAVYLGPGEHTVRFVFDPFSFKLGLCISLTTVILILLYIVYKRRL